MAGAGRANPPLLKEGPPMGRGGGPCIMGGPGGNATRTGSDPRITTEAETGIVSFVRMAHLPSLLGSSYVGMRTTVTAGREGNGAPSTFNSTICALNLPLFILVMTWVAVATSPSADV
jgi:hypothetical protein